MYRTYCDIRGTDYTHSAKRAVGGADAGVEGMLDRGPTANVSLGVN